MRLNLGSGWHRLDGWTNVDLYADDADVKADLRTVEFPPGSVSAILSTHTIEHLEHADAIGLFRRCFTWLESGGRIAIETPDRAKCMALINQGKHLEGAKGIFGGRSINKAGWHQWLVKWAKNNGSASVPNEWNLPGEAHLYVWTAAELSQALADAGFEDVLTETPVYHGARGWRDCRVTGRKP